MITKPFPLSELHKKLKIFRIQAEEIGSLDESETRSRKILAVPPAMARWTRQPR